MFKLTKTLTKKYTVSQEPKQHTVGMFLYFIVIDRRKI